MKERSFRVNVVDTFLAFQCATLRRSYSPFYKKAIEFLFFFSGGGAGRELTQRLANLQLDNIPMRRSEIRNRIVAAGDSA